MMKIYTCDNCGVEIIATGDIGEVYRPDQEEQKKIEEGKAVLLYSPLKPLNCLKCGKTL